MGRDKSYFVKDQSDSNKKFSETDIIKMLDFLIDNILVTFGGRVLSNRLSAFQWEQTVHLYLPTCFFYYYEADFMQELLRKKDKKLAISFYSTFRYKDDVLSLNNSKFGDQVERIYPIELEIKDTTDTVKSASYLDLHLEIDNEGLLKQNLRQKR